MKSRLLIGVITTGCHTEYQSEIMRGIISQAFKSSCDIAVICPLTNFLIETTHKFNEQSIFSLIMSDVFDGFLYDRNSFYNEKTQNYIDRLCTRSGKPVMLMDYNGHNQFETTSTDDCEAFEIITDHLIDVHGYKKIFCLTGQKGVFSAEERVKGFLRSMKKHNLPVDKSCYMYGDFWTAAPAELAEKITSKKIEKPDAVVCGNDVMAYTLSERLINSGFRVPEDIAITGFDATMDGYCSNPSITSYKRPNFQLGAEAFRRLYRIITGRICSKVPNEPGKLRLGRSCGCTENPALKREIQHKLKIEERFQKKMFCSDMLIYITNSCDLDSLINNVDHYTYLIYRMSQMFICVTDKFKNSIETANSGKLDFTENDPVNIVFDKSAVVRNLNTKRCCSSGDALNSFRLNRKHPSAFYISPLHYNDNFFGYAAVSFGKYPIAYSRLYVQWINYVNMALEKVRIQSAMNQTMQKLDSLAVYDSITGLLSRNGLQNAYSGRLSRIQSDFRTVTYLHIELPELKKIYCQSGNEAAVGIIKNFSEILKACVSKDEICGTISPECFGIISFNTERSDEIFSDIKSRLETSRYSRGDQYDVSFTIGVYSCDIYAEIPSFSELIYKAVVNRTHSYFRSENSVNPHFEKLCSLRNQLMKNPELSWNISEIADRMFISKSYLQKIYKAAFNKSIIEELIQFRLNKAKELLLETDMTVSDIAKECGYSTYNYFVRQFRAAEHIPPSEYRENHKSTDPSKR